MNFLSLVSPFMHRELCHIYGPFGIYSYGLAIALGLGLFIALIKHDKQFTQLNLETMFPSILLLGIGAGILGGKLLYLLTEPITHMRELVSGAQAGFSILGCIATILLVVPWYHHRHTIPALPFFDLVAVYAPIIHAISRLGCFAAGCCYGIATTGPWGVMYTDSQSAAPLYCSIHPTQLYSAGIFFILFAILYYFLRTRITWPGGLLGCYLIGAGLERFTVDFLRADRIFFSSTIPISTHQALALVLVAAGCGLFMFHRNNQTI